MEFIHHLQDGTKTKFYIAILSVTIGFLSLAYFDSPTDHKTQAKNIKAVLENITALVISDAEAASINIPMVPQSFSSLAEMVSPAVVNIQTVKTMKSGGRVFRHFR